MSAAYPHISRPRTLSSKSARSPRPPQRTARASDAPERTCHSREHHHGARSTSRPPDANSSRCTPDPANTRSSSRTRSGTPSSATQSGHHPRIAAATSSRDLRSVRSDAHVCATAKESGSLPSRPEASSLGRSFRKELRTNKRRPSLPSDMPSSARPKDVPPVPPLPFGQSHQVRQHDTRTVEPSNRVIPFPPLEQKTSPKKFAARLLDEMIHRPKFEGPYPPPQYTLKQPTWVERQNVAPVPSDLQGTDTKQSVDKFGRAVLRMTPSELVDIFIGRHTKRMPDLADKIVIGLRYHLSFEQLLRLVIDRYDEDKSDDIGDHVECAIQKQTTDGIVAFLARWLELHWHPVLDAGAAPLLGSFVRRIVPELPASSITKLGSALALIEQRHPRHRGTRFSRQLDELERLQPTQSPPPTSFQMRRKSPSDRPVDVLAVVDRPGGPQELARQLTLQQWEILRLVHPEDAVRVWMNGPKALTSSEASVQRNLDAYDLYEKAVVLWVTDTILCGPDAKRRWDLYDVFIAVAMECIQLRNFSGAFAIHSGCRTPAVHRLFTTQELVSTRLLRMKSWLDSFFDAGGNSEIYRSTVNARPMAPSLPHTLALLNQVAGIKNARAFEVSYDESGNVRSFPISQYTYLAEIIAGLEICHRPFGITRHDGLSAWLGEQLHSFRSMSVKEREHAYEEQYTKSLALLSRALKTRLTT